MTTETIWVFNSEGARFPGGVFGTRAQAEQWIKEHLVSGVLTEYPLNIGVYDWAVSSGHFTPKRPEQSSPRFIGGFTSAIQNHFHYENGIIA